MSLRRAVLLGSAAGMALTLLGCVVATIVDEVRTARQYA